MVKIFVTYPMRYCHGHVDFYRLHCAGRSVLSRQQTLCGSHIVRNRAWMGAPPGSVRRHRREVKLSLEQQEALDQLTTSGRNAFIAIALMAFAGLLGIGYIF